MAKKDMRLTSGTAKKTSGYIAGGLNDLLKEVSESSSKDTVVRMNFEVSESLRNSFKSITAQQGKKVKEVLVSLMREYVKKETTN